MYAGLGRRQEHCQSEQIAVRLLPSAVTASDTFIPRLLLYFSIENVLFLKSGIFKEPF